MSTTNTTVTPEKLAKAQKYLIGAFLFGTAIPLMSLAVLYGGSLELAISISPILDIASLAANILLCVALYIGARRLGFRQLTTILAIILAFFFPLFGLILVLSASIRLTQKLRSHGWKVGLLGARRA